MVVPVFVSSTFRDFHGERDVIRSLVSPELDHLLAPFRLIEDAEFLVFDLTGERPGVYYELGFAHGVGNESDDILLLAREGTKLHYDVAGLRVHYYDSLERLANAPRDSNPRLQPAALPVEPRVRRIISARDLLTISSHRARWHPAGPGTGLRITGPPARQGQIRPQLQR